MPTALLYFILALSLNQISIAPSDNVPASDGLEDVRVQLRRLWFQFVMRSRIPRNPFATGVKFNYVVFYKVNDSVGRSIQPRPGTCIDIPPPKGISADTCEKQRDSGYCEARLSGINKDGLCARTCGFCTIGNFGMRTSFEFITNKTITKGRRKGHRVHHLVTLEMQPTGHLRVYNTYNDTMSMGLHCQANRVLPRTIERRLRM